MSSSPYRPGAGRMPAYLAGRETERRAVQTLLREAADTGFCDENPWSFIGPRGLGKTALLGRARDDARELGYVVAEVSCARGESVVSEVAKRVASALRRVERTETPNPAGRRTRLGSLTLEVGVPGVVKVGAVTAPGEEPRDTFSSGDLGEFLQDAAAWVRGRGGAGLVVCVDEVHVVEEESGGAVWMNAMQGISAAPADPVITLCAGLTSTPRRLEAAATFAERFVYLPLRSLDRAATGEALVEPASLAGVSWSAPALALAWQHTLGYPYFVQELGHHTWQAGAPDRGDRLTEEHVDAGYTRMRSTLSWFFGRRWAACTDQERDVLTTMVDLGGEDVQRGQIAAAMGKSTQEISVARANLIERGLIEPAGHGRLSLALAGFLDYARMRVHGEPPAV